MPFQSNSAPLVSIVVATYNGEKYLEQQLESLIHQTYPNLEIVVTDDRSTDGTPAILQSYAERYPHFRYVINDTNLGFIKNFEKACTLAKGEYISLCDQDDVWDLDKTSLLINAIGSHMLVFCDSLFVDENLRSLGRRHSDVKQFRSFDNCLYFAQDDCVCGHATVFRRELLEHALPFPPKTPHDQWLPFVATFHGTLLCYDKALVQWRQHSKNVTGAPHDVQYLRASNLAVLEAFYQYCPATHAMEKKVLYNLKKSNEGYTLANNFLRMVTYFRYQRYLLGMKKRNAFRKFLFCIKMFWQIRLNVL